MSDNVRDILVIVALTVVGALLVWGIIAFVTTHLAITFHAGSGA
ncbi:MAG: hypothetical protein ACOYB3_01665 [Azonexus sp.]